MADSNGYFPLDSESDNLSPLPDGHRQGLAAVAVLAGVSFVSSTIVLFYLTFKLIRWHIKTRRLQKTGGNTDDGQVDLSLGLAECHFTADNRTRSIKTGGKTQPNQFLILIFNLLLADIHQSAAFLLNAVWVRKGGIDIRTPACFAQGWLVSTGDLSSSCFITAIAVHTYLAVVWNYKPPQAAVYFTIVGLWIFNYLLAIIGPVITKNGREYGGFYVRAAAWCWVNIKYETLRLVLHYLFIFISLALTSILYSLIFFSLRKRARNPEARLPTVAPRVDHTHSNSPKRKEKPSDPHTPPPSSGHHKAFLLYPVIYVVCTAPLALGRIATMAGVNVPISYFCTAGALITSNGWLDVLLWGLTRRQLLFGGDVDAEGNGLDTFTFMRTPVDRKYGNMVWVEGAGGPGRGAPGVDDQEEGDGSGGWVLGLKRRVMGWRRLGFGSTTGQKAGRQGVMGRQKWASSQESLRGGASGRQDEPTGGIIQMDLVTSVVVETEEGASTKGTGCGTEPADLGPKQQLSAYLQAMDSERRNR